MAIALSHHDIGSGPPLVILHGLFGSKRNWASVARALADHRRVITVDLRNHGESPWDDRHDYPALADDVAKLIEEVAGGPAAVIGHSMGGKAAMVLALSRPDLVERLVVVDIAPAASTATSIEMLRAMRAVPLAACSRRADVEAALAATVKAPALRSFLVQSIRTGPNGLSWGINLAVLERQFQEILGFPEVPTGVRYTGPVLFLSGGRSEYVRPEHHATIAGLFPASSIEVIADAGHWIHAEAPDLFRQKTEAFLKQQ